MINLFLEDEAIFLKLGRCDYCSNLLKFYVSVVLHAVHFPHIRNKNTLSVLKYPGNDFTCRTPRSVTARQRTLQRRNTTTGTVLTPHQFYCFFLFFFVFLFFYSFLRPKYKCVLALSLWIVFWFLFCEVFLFRNLFCYFLLCRNTVIILPPQNSP